MDKSFDQTPFSKVSPQAYYPDYTVLLLECESCFETLWVLKILENADKTVRNIF